VLTWEEFEAFIIMLDSEHVYREYSLDEIAREYRQWESRHTLSRPCHSCLGGKAPFSLCAHMRRLICAQPPSRR
jgi:hypothetical protein